MPSTRVKGHGLVVTVSDAYLGEFEGRCECGERGAGQFRGRPGNFYRRRQLRDWHREHKAAILAAQQKEE